MFPKSYNKWSPPVEPFLATLQVIDGKLPMNHQITYMLQEIFNLIPDVTEPSFVKSVNVNTNDQVGYSQSDQIRRFFAY
jgi:hypothetical protein